MRWEKPWSASVGTQKKASAKAAHTSTPAAAASAGSGLFRNHVFKGSPANDRKDDVVEGQETEVAAALELREG